MSPTLCIVVTDVTTPHSTKTEEESDQPAIFERIDAGKLQGALKNASVLTSLEVGSGLGSGCGKIPYLCCCVQHEGVPSHLLPAVAQQQAANEEKTKQEKKMKVYNIMRWENSPPAFTKSSFTH